MHESVAGQTGTISVRHVYLLPDHLEGAAGCTAVSCHGRESRERSIKFERMPVRGIGAAQGNPVVTNRPALRHVPAYSTNGKAIAKRGVRRRWLRRKTTVDLSVILVSYNTLELTRKALSHLFASSHDVEMEVFVIDNASKDTSAEVLRREYPNITLIENEKNVGFGRANNLALPLIHSRYVLLLNTDAFVAPDSIAKTVQYMDDHPGCGILGAKFLGRDGELQPSCRFFPTPWNIFLARTGLDRFFKRARMVDDMSWDHASVRDCDWVPGCYFLVRKTVIDQVGLFDPRYFLYYEEVDHCFAAKRAGWSVTYFPHTSVVHLGGESARQEGGISAASGQIESLRIESELLYFRKNHGLAGVLQHLLLSSLADAIQSAKDVVKLRSLAKIIFNLRRALFVWKSFLRTRFGTVPTR